jgi:hypothetical protein
MTGDSSMSLGKVGVILPSRGLLFSETADELLQNLKNIPHKIYFAHKLPIPDCFETPLTEALKDPEVTHIWLVEDDMILPPTILKEMIDKKLAVVTVNYPTTNRGDSSILTIKDRIVYGGTGCTLVKREVFSELKSPYFRSDIAWVPKNKGNYIKFTGVKKGGVGAYGLHDVNFFINLYRLGIPVHKLDYSIGQRKLVALGKAGTNNGAHKIEVWRKVKRDRYFTLKKNLPVDETGKLTSVMAGNKEITVSKSHARKLIKLGLATQPPKRAVVIDDNEVLDV